MAYVGQNMSAEVAQTDGEPLPNNHIRSTFEVTDIDKPWDTPPGHSIHVFAQDAETSLCGHVDADQHPTSRACDADHDRPLTYDTELCDHCARSVRKRVRETELTTGYDSLDAIIEAEEGDELTVEAGGETYTFTVEDTGFSINSVYAEGETGREAPDGCEYWADTAKVTVKPDGTTEFKAPYNILEGAERVPATVRTDGHRTLIADGGSVPPLKFVIVYSDNSTEAVEMSDHIEIRTTDTRTYADIDGELYGNAGPRDVDRVSMARSQEI
jgi:hypothetical protein